MSAISESLPQRTDDIDVARLGRALWRSKGLVLGLALAAGAIAFIVLSMLRPLYTSEARILIQNEDQVFTRPAEDQGRDLPPPALDEQAVQSQVQVLTSRDLALQVIRGLDLVNNPDFAKDEGRGVFRRLLDGLGLGQLTPESEEEKAANAFATHLDVFQLAKSSAIAIEYSSGSSELAARIANKLADAYIGWQRDAKIEQTKDATAWLETQIEVLRKRTSESEEAVEQFRAKQGLYAGSNNVTLNAQQLSELNSQLILAKAQRSEAEARAKLIKTMLAENGDIDATPEVLKSALIGRLIEQRVQVQRQLAELSATLMPSHPRIKQLQSELADVRAQIRAEAQKIVKGLENEAQVASAREASLKTSLSEAQSQASGASDAEVKLRALEREAKSNRDLLESYLARYRDASARHDMGAVPAQAAIVSRAHASILPSFPKKGPITLLVMVATALLALATIAARELMAAPITPQATRTEQAPEFVARRRRKTVAERAPAAPPAIPQPVAEPEAKITAKAEPAVEQSGKAEPHESVAKPVEPEPAAPKQQKSWFTMPSLPPLISAPKAKPEPAPAEQPVRDEAATRPPAKTPDFSASDAKPTPAETMRPAAQAKDTSSTPITPERKLPRPSWPGLSPKPEAAASKPKPAAPADEPSETRRRGDGTSKAAIAQPEKEAPTGNVSPASGMLERLRRNVAVQSAPAPAKPSLNAKQLVEKLRNALPLGQGSAKPSQSEAASPQQAAREDAPPLRANDLRHYLSQRIGAKFPNGRKADSAEDTPPAPEPGNGKIGPALKSIDAVLDHVLAAAKGSAPRALLISGVSAKVDATNEAIQIARALVARREQIVLVDLTRGPAAISGRLGLPRAPGFTDLVGGRARFEQVIKVDESTPLQVIPAGNPALKGGADGPDRFMQIFEALTEAYDSVVLHADPDAVRALMPSLKFELPAVVVVLAAGASVQSEDATLRSFAALGCPVLVYEPGGKDRRTGLFGRAAAI